MRLEQLQKILEQLRVKTPTKIITSKSTLNWLIYLGVSDEHILKFVVRIFANKWSFGAFVDDYPLLFRS